MHHCGWDVAGSELHAAAAAKLARATSHSLLLQAADGGFGLNPPYSFTKYSNGEGEQPALQD